MIGLYENERGQFLYVVRALDCVGAHLEGIHAAEYTDLGHTYWLARRVATVNFGGRVRAESPDVFELLWFPDRAKPLLNPPTVLAVKLEAKRRLEAMFYGL